MQIYEQIGPDTKFGQQMVKNLEARGAPLRGLAATPTLDAHRGRLNACGFPRALARDLLSIYRGNLPPPERRRIEALELFDEFEEWELLMSHYCVAVGVKDAAGVLAEFSFPEYPAAVGGEGAPRSPFPAGLPNAD